MRYMAGIVAVILLATIVIFSIQNLGAVDVSFLTWSASVPKFLVIIGSYVLGTLTGWSVVGVLKRGARLTSTQGKRD